MGLIDWEICKSLIGRGLIREKGRYERMEIVYRRKVKNRRRQNEKRNYGTNEKW